PSAPRFAPSSLNCTPTTPTLSVARAETVTVPETVAPAAGAVIDTVGGGLSLRTVTLTAAAVAVLAAASRATAVRVWVALVAVVVFHERAYGAVVISAPRLAPSSLNWTPTTPTLSEAVAETVTVPETVEPAAGAVMETVGTVVSGGARVVTVTSPETARLPTASRAFTRWWYTVLADSPLSPTLWLLPSALASAVT